MALEDNKSSHPSSSGVSGIANYSLIQKILSAAMVLAAIVLLFTAFQWLVADYTNLVEQTPRLHEDLAAVVPDGDISGDQFALVSYGLEQQRFPQGVLSILLSIVLLFFAVQVIQPRLKPAMVFALGGLSLILLVVLVRLSDLWPLALIIVPVAISMFMATDVMPVPNVEDTAQIEAEVDEGLDKLIGAASSPILNQTADGSDEVSPGDSSAPAAAFEESSEQSGEEEGGVLETETAAPVVLKPDVILEEQKEGVAEAPEEELDRFEVPEIDQMTITGLMNRPSIFENFEGWDDEASVSSTGESDSTEGASAEGTLTKEYSSEDASAEPEVEVENSEPIASVNSDGLVSEHAAQTADDLAEGEGGLVASESPLPEESGVSSAVVEPRISGVGNVDEAAPDEVIQLEHSDLDFEVDGEVVARLFGHSLDTLMSAEYDALEAEGEKTATPSEIDLTAYDPLASQEIDELMQADFLESLLEDGQPGLKSGQIEPAGVGRYDGAEEISDVSDLIDEDLLSATGLFDPDAQGEDDLPARKRR